MARVLVHDHGRCAGFTAGLPLNDVDASLAEVDRAVADLGALGFQLYSNVNGIPLDAPRFEPLFARAEELDLVIWLHPTRSPAWPDYPTEGHSRHGIWWSIGWPYADTAVFGAPHALRCAVDFFGPDHVLFGTDMPLAGPEVVAATIADVESLSLPEAQRRQVYEGNARSLFKPGTVPEHFA